MTETAEINPAVVDDHLERIDEGRVLLLDALNAENPETATAAAGQIRTAVDGLLSTLVTTDAPEQTGYEWPPITLADMAKEVRQVNIRNGWYEDERTFGEDLALLHSEVSEALEAYRDHGFKDMTMPVETDPARRGYPPKPEGVGSELADVLIRLLDTCDREKAEPFWWKIRLAEAPRFHQITCCGSFGDEIAELHRLIAWRDLTSLLPALLSVAEKHGIDLHAEYRRKVAYNRTRGHKHGGKRL